MREALSEMSLMTEEYLSEMKRLCKERYEEYENFIKAEKEKEEGISEEVKDYLLEKGLSELSKSVFKECKLKNYSSGKKVGVFDEIGFFMETKFFETGFSEIIFVFCEQEIDSYAKSYRILKPKIPSKFIQNREYLVKVFEFKKDKI
jgi:hypothetical protein